MQLFILTTEQIQNEKPNIYVVVSYSWRGNDKWGKKKWIGGGKNGRLKRGERS